MTTKTTQTIWSKLAEPFTPDLEHAMPQTVAGNGNSALVAWYLDSRGVGERLDDVVGPENWYFDWEHIGNNIVKGNLAIRINDEWVIKSDVGYPNDTKSTMEEHIKSAVSDALKRAAVLWGIGRYLYRIEKVWFPCETKTGQNGKLQFVKWKGTPTHKPVTKNSPIVVHEKDEVIEEEVEQTKLKVSDSTLRDRLTRGLTIAANHPIDLTKYEVTDDTTSEQLSDLVDQLTKELLTYEVFNDKDVLWKEFEELRDKAEDVGLPIPDKKNFKPPLKRAIVQSAIDSLTKALEGKDG